MDEQPTEQEKIREASLHDIARGDLPALQERLSELSPAELSQLLESVPESEREQIWDQLPEEKAGEVLAEMGDMACTALARDLHPAEIIAATEGLEIPDLAEVIDKIPEELGEAIIESLAPDEREAVTEILSYPEEAIARLMRPEFVAVRAGVTLEVVLRYLRRRESLPRNTDGLMVIDRQGHYLGKLLFSVLLTADPSRLVQEVMLPGADQVEIATPREEVAALFERRDLVSVAVIDEEGILAGLVTVDDVVDVIREIADQRFLNMAGLEEDEDLFAPVIPSAKRRATWLGINLVTAFLAAWVIGLFEATLDQIVALAVLMPIVASMGGIAGSQTLTLAIRGLAMGQISGANTRWLTTKEAGVGLLNGFLWALVVGLVAFLWFHEIGIGLVIAAALIANLLIAALSGVLVPLLLDRFGIDPALSGAVILTTITDVVGFMMFLGLATLFLL